jgi:hypothetical protein
MTASLVVRYAARLFVKCCSTRLRIKPLAVVPCFRSASSLAFSGIGIEIFIRIVFIDRLQIIQMMYICII